MYKITILPLLLSSCIFSLDVEIDKNSNSQKHLGAFEYTAIILTPIDIAKLININATNKVVGNNCILLAMKRTNDSGHQILQFTCRVEGVNESSTATIGMNFPNMNETQTASISTPVKDITKVVIVGCIVK